MIVGLHQTVLLAGSRLLISEHIAVYVFVYIHRERQRWLHQHFSPVFLESCRI